MKPENNAYSSVHKALSLLEAFITLPEETRAVEISRFVGINRSTTTRLLATLRDRGYLNQNPINKKFSLGLKIKEIYQSFESSSHWRLVTHAKPLMEELRNRLQESILLGIPTEDGISVCHISEGTRFLRLHSTTGTINPYNTGAGGKLLLAFSSLDFQEKILASKFQQRTPNSLIDPLKLKAELSRIVSQGFAVDREENHLGIQGLAVPIFDRNNKVKATLIVAGSAYTVSEDKIDYFLENLRHAAEKNIVVDLIDTQILYRAGNAHLVLNP